ncbi:outer membrane protein [Bartonella sp. DGB1]|uniref:outer membrane protein n=1 Tax=Bartonella sp. DGB1 TaxID=3239807 RepID=UPI00352541CA
MKLKYLPYLLLCFIFSMSQATSADLTKLNRAPTSKVLDNKKHENHWSGAYAGLQYSLAINHYKNPWKQMLSITKNGEEQFPKDKFASINNASHLAGLFLGYNHTVNDTLIFGAEIDFSFKLKSDELHYPKYPKGNQFNYYKPIELPLNGYLDGNLRARLGVNLGNFLPYIAGGLSVIYDLPNKNMMEYAQDSIKNTVDRKEIQIKINGDDKLYLGWNLGTGIEHKTEQGLIIRAEYRYNNITSNQNKKISFTQQTEKTKKANIITYGLESLSSHEVRLGLGYHF